MNILIAGGSGLIGRELSRFLLTQGHEVKVLTRSPQEAGLPSGVEAVRWDAKTLNGWGHLVAQTDAIINLAGANIGARPWTRERKRVIRKSRQDAGQAIVKAVEQAEKRPAVILQIAGVGYYGIQQGDRALDEQAHQGTDFLSGVAADWEEAIRPVEELGVRLVIMRSGVVLSQEGGVLKPFVYQHNLFAGGPLGSGKQWISWIHMEDLLRSFQFFLEHSSTHGVYNVSSPEPVTNAEFNRTVGAVMHRPYWLPAPAIAIKLLLGEMSTLVLDGQRVVPVRLQASGFSFKYGSLRKALENLLQP